MNMNDSIHNHLARMEREIKKGRHKTAARMGQELLTLADGDSDVVRSWVSRYTTATGR